MQKKGKKIKLRKQFNDILFDLYKKGHGLPKHKNEHNSTRLIHSDSTLKTYHAQCMRFVDFCYSQGVKYDMDEAFKLIPAYGQTGAFYHAGQERHLTGRNRASGRS